MAHFEYCPHCGETKLIELQTTEREDRPKCKWTAEVACLNCFASVHTHGFCWTEDEAKEEVIKAWNRRYKI